MSREVGEAFKTALRRLAATPCIIAARADDGTQVGMTATAVAALSTGPASLLVSIDRARSLHRLIHPGRRFSVNLLDQRNAGLCAPFAGGASQTERFALGDWRDDNGALFLAGAASFSCATQAALDYATHTIVVGLVEQVRLGGDGGPVAYAEGALHSLTPWAPDELSILPNGRGSTAGP